MLKYLLSLKMLEDTTISSQHASVVGNLESTSSEFQWNDIIKIVAS